MRMRGGILAFADDEFRGCMSEFVLRLADRGERDCGACGELNVVVTDDGDVVGDAQACAGERANRAEREEVVGADEGGEVDSLRKRRLHGHLA